MSISQSGETAELVEPAPDEQGQATKPKRKRPPKGQTDFAASFVELGELLFTSREAFSRWQKLPGAPVKRADGRHCISEWRAFMRERGLKSDTRAKPGAVAAEADAKNIDEIFGDALKDAETRVKIRERELKIAIRRGEYIAAADVKARWAYHVGQASTLLRKKLEDELPPILAGLDGPGIRKRLAKVVDEFTATLHAGG